MASEPQRGKITLEKLEQLVRNGHIDTIISAFPDMQGRLMGKRVTGEFFLEHAREGAHFCTYLLGTDMEMRTPQGYSITNWDTGYGDWVAVPDWNTLRIIPWHEKTALFIGDVKVEATNEEVPVAPRTMLKRQLERAKALGFTMTAASELEFYLLKETYEEAAAKHFHDLQPFGWYNEDYHLLQASKAEPLYRQFRNLMIQAGVPIEASKGEAAPGQHELNIHYSDALEAADRHVLFKHGVKEIAWQNGRAVTFMAKPNESWTGSSAHVHLSAWHKNGEKNAFYDEEASPYHMSTTMRHFLGGLMHGIREMCYFIAPFVNSYKRFAALSWAPVHIVWGKDNRTCGFRIVGDGQSLRIENRFPGGDTNPYLAYAALIGLGLYGIENSIEPPAEFVGNGYAANDQPRVPRALWESIIELEKSKIARAIFGESVVEHYLNAARVEQQAYDEVVTCWERQRYLERG